MDPQVVGLGLIAVATASLAIRLWAHNKPERHRLGWIAGALLVVMLVGLVSWMLVMIVAFDMRDF